MAALSLTMPLNRVQAFDKVVEAPKGATGQNSFCKIISIVALLLDAGANAREPEFWGKSPIDAARQYGHENIVELLKAAGA